MLAKQTQNTTIPGPRLGTVHFGTANLTKTTTHFARAGL